MAILENQLNGRIATLLGRMAPEWSVRGENKGAFQGNQKQPDILVTQTGAQPVVIENEYLPANTVEEEALERLGESLDASVVQATGKVNAVVALRSPADLHDCAGLDDVDSLLKQGVTLDYALFTGPSDIDATRFPKSGFIKGSIRDLAAFVEYAATPEDAVRSAVMILEEGVQDAAAILRLAADQNEDTQAAIVGYLKQSYDDQTLRMAATIMVNALVFHQNLAGQHGVKNLTQVASADGVLTQANVLEEWQKILGVNYWSIFNIASDLLRCINPPEMAVEALKVMSRTADRLVGLGVSQSHDLAGTVFQRLIADRKFLATFYTRPESATLLAHLAIPDDGDWNNVERVKDFRIADYACGTGTLIHAAYRRLNQLHWLAGGKPEKLHAHMMENALTACDVLPSSVHLTASMLSSSYPTQRYEGSRTIVMQYGKTEQGVSIGSLDLLGETGMVRSLIPMHTATAVTGTGEAQSRLDVEMPPVSQDLVIMNPPFTSGGSDYTEGNPAGYNKKQFHGLDTDWETQERMFNLAKDYTKGTCYHGYAGIASGFVAVADRMVKKGGTIALVLPMTALQGVSWQKVRQLIGRGYRDVKVLTIATARQHDQSFSADTGMAETMIVCDESSNAPGKRGLFVSLQRRPDSEMEATEIARAIKATVESVSVRSLEGGPFGGSQLLVGDELLGEMIDAQLSVDAPWSAVGISDYAVVQTVYQLVNGKIWLPQMKEQEAVGVPMTNLDHVCRVGITDNNIVGNGSQTAFSRIKPPSAAPTHPMLWGHNAQLETRMVVAPDSEGRVKPGREQRAEEIWDTRSHAHHNRDFRFNSQPLAVAFTEKPTIGGTSWPNVKFDERSHEIAYTLWGNTTLGLLCYWWHSSRQQAGRGRMPITAIRSMPTLDVTKLSPVQLAKAEEIFEDMRDSQFLPANEAYRDNTRKELDHRVLIDMLGLPESILEPLELLRLKWCSEPSVHGGKKTAPEG